MKMNLKIVNNYIYNKYIWRAGLIKGEPWPRKRLRPWIRIWRPSLQFNNNMLSYVIICVCDEVQHSTTTISLSDAVTWKDAMNCYEWFLIATPFFTISDWHLEVTYNTLMGACGGAGLCEPTLLYIWYVKWRWDCGFLAYINIVYCIYIFFYLHVGISQQFQLKNFDKQDESRQRRQALS